MTQVFYTLALLPCHMFSLRMFSLFSFPICVIKARFINPNALNMSNKPWIWQVSMHSPPSHLSVRFSAHPWGQWCGFGVEESDHEKVYPPEGSECECGQTFPALTGSHAQIRSDRGISVSGKMTLLRLILFMVFRIGKELVGNGFFKAAVWCDSNFVVKTDAVNDI